jgi:hypothetical protein
MSSGSPMNPTPNSDPSKVTPANFWATYDTCFQRAASPKAKLNWLLTARKRTTKLNECYRIHAADIDADIVKVAEAIAGSESGFNEKAITYYLRQFWRWLMANYAVCEAARVEGLLLGRKDRAGLIWRLLAGYSLPRLWAAVALGYAAVLNSSDLLTTLARISDSFAATWSCVGILVSFSFFLGMLDIQRRIGRRFGALVFRSVLLVIVGAAWIAVALTIHAWLSAWLHTAFYFRYRVLGGAVALVLAHLLQLFWHEYSNAEPL